MERINTRPRYAGWSYCEPFGINNNGQVVGISETTGNANDDAFLYMNKQMYDLNSLLFNQHTGWTLGQGMAINDAGQIAGIGGNGPDGVSAFLLNPLPPGAVSTTSIVQTNLPVMSSSYPAPQAGKNSLIVITHGWINTNIETVEQSVAFVDSMSNSICEYLSLNGMTNWQVYGLKWTNGANIPLSHGGFETALVNAAQQGNALGECIVSQGLWTHIHFIAHSAGAALIQKATEEVRASLGNNVTIHCTFLDPYDGALFGEVGIYGNKKADWSDKLLFA